MPARLFAAAFAALLALAPTAALAANETLDDGLSGFTGFVADIIVRLGEFGVLVLVFVETVFPPIPSEIILSLAGYLSERGRMNVGLVVAAATAGSVLGALVLYGLGAWFGEQRAKEWIARLPLVEMRDMDKASAWFHRHGEPVVFFGRFVPIVRSMVSLPAGAQRMHLVPFILLTALGSAMWNSALIGAGYALGTQYHRIENYTRYLDYGAAIGIAAFAAWFLAPRLWRRMNGTSGQVS
jgi:membrane protein DedA with SNARE-associated domain